MKYTLSWARTTPSSPPLNLGHSGPVSAIIDLSHGGTVAADATVESTLADESLFEPVIAPDTDVSPKVEAAVQTPVVNPDMPDELSIPAPPAASEAPSDIDPAQQALDLTPPMMLPTDNSAVQFADIAPESAGEARRRRKREAKLAAKAEAERARAAKLQKTAAAIKPALQLERAAETAPIPVAIAAPALGKVSETILQKAPRTPAFARWAYPVAICGALAWGGGMTAFAIGYRDRLGAFEYAPFPVVVFVSLAMLPAVFMLLAAFAIRQGAHLAAATANARQMADDLVIPSALAAQGAGSAAAQVATEVERVTRVTAEAEAALLGLRQTLAEETTRLTEATAEAERTARALGESLSQERTQMGELAASLDGQARAVTDAITDQTRLVAQASDLASVTIAEAEAALAARAADLAAAAGEAANAADLAGQVLERETARLDQAADSLTARVDGSTRRLGVEHDRLATLADALSAGQEDIAARLEAQRLGLATATSEARQASHELVEGAGHVAAASSDGIQALRNLIGQAAAQVRTLVEGVESEQAALDARTRASLNLFTGAVAEERAAIEDQTRAALMALAAAADGARAAAAAGAEEAAARIAHQAASARRQVDELGEHAFAAAQKTDQAFDARISSARRIIDEAGALVEAAGDRAVERVEAGLSGARTVLGELQGLLHEVDARIAAMPKEAQGHAETVRAAVEKSLADLTAAARNAALETEAVDTAFQGRVKRNYDTLSEAIRLMGEVASAATAAASRPSPAPGPAPAPLPERVRQILPEPVAEPLRLVAGERAVRMPPSAATLRQEAPFTPQALAHTARTSVSTPPPIGAATPSAEVAGLRPRLRLSAGSQLSPPVRPEPVLDEPALSDLGRNEPVRSAAPRSDFGRRATAGSSSSSGGDWSWKELLSSIDEPPLDDEALAERLLAEIEALDIDLRGLFPTPRIDEIAAARQGGDTEGARIVVRGLAPGAVRRVSRRLLTDKLLRAHAERYVARYGELLADSARRDRDGYMMATLLASDPGRAFMLFDAGVGELS